MYFFYQFKKLNVNLIFNSDLIILKYVVRIYSYIKIKSYCLTFFQNIPLTIFGIFKNNKYIFIIQPIRRVAADHLTFQMSLYNKHFHILGLLEGLLKINIKIF